MVHAHACVFCYSFYFMTGEMTKSNMELVRVTNEGKVIRFTQEEVQEYLDEAE